MAKKIGRGTYGCVYKPTLKCDTYEYGSKQKHVDGISKFVLNTTDVINELHNLSIADHLDPSNKYHIGNVQKCDHISKSEYKYIHDCEIYKANPLPLNRYTIIDQEYGGNTLENISIDPSTNTFKLFSDFTNIFEAVVKFSDNNFIHMDIKPQNIVYTSKKGMRLIDFGLAVKSENLYISMDEMRFDGISYPFWPPEFYSLNLEPSHTFYDVLKSWHEHLSMLDFYEGKHISFSERYKLHRTNIKPPIFIIRKLRKTIDMYSTAITLLFVIKSVENVKPEGIIPKNIKKRLHNLISAIINSPNYSNSLLPPSHALDEYKKIIKIWDKKIKTSVDPVVSEKRVSSTVKAKIQDFKNRAKIRDEKELAYAVADTGSEEIKMADEETKMIDEETKMADEETKMADEETKMVDEETKMTEEETSYIEAMKKMLKLF